MKAASFCQKCRVSVKKWLNGSVSDHLICSVLWYQPTFCVCFLFTFLPHFCVLALECWILPWCALLLQWTPLFVVSSDHLAILSSNGKSNDHGFHINVTDSFMSFPSNSESVFCLYRVLPKTASEDLSQKVRDQKVYTCKQKQTRNNSSCKKVLDISTSWKKYEIMRDWNVLR